MSKAPKAKEAPARKAPLYNETRRYKTNHVVEHNGVFYRAKADTMPFEGPPNEKLWRRVAHGTEPSSDQELFWS